MQGRRRDWRKNVGESIKEVVYSIPQLGQMLFAQTADGQMVNYGQVVACKLCRDAVTREESIRVKTTVFPDGIDVRLATGVFMPEIKW